MTIAISPVDETLVFKRPDLADAINSFLQINLPGIPVADKAWMVYTWDGEAIRVLGYAACNIGGRIADVPVYHILPATTRGEKLEAMRAHELLFARVTGFIADTVGIGTQAFFYIAPEAQEHWKEFSKRVNGRNANRFVMEV